MLYLYIYNILLCDISLYKVLVTGCCHTSKKLDNGVIIRLKIKTNDMAYKRKGIDFGNSPPPRKEDVTYGVGGKEVSAYGTKYYTSGGKKIAKDVDEGELGKIQKGKDGRRHVVHSNGTKYYLSAK